jgi:large subunit ribosomal protein L4e
VVKLMAESEKEPVKKTKKPEGEIKTPKKVKTKKKSGKEKTTKKAATKKKAKPKKVDKVNLYSIDGKTKGKILLPKVFFEDVRTDVIRRAHKASRANRRQPYGPNPQSGMMHAVSTWGKGRGVSRVQRLTQGRAAAESPNNVGGRRAHPPIHDHDWSEKINKKERGLARKSALSATKEADLVTRRGHKFDDSVTLPIIVEDAFAKLKTTREAIAAMEKLGIADDLERARTGVHVRAGRGKMRGRKYRKPKSVLLVVTKAEKTKRGFGNIAGVDVSTPENLNIELLAPGGMPGRLTLITRSALKRMESW